MPDAGERGRAGASRGEGGLDLSLWGIRRSCEQGAFVEEPDGDEREGRGGA